jgi:5-formyltetrahydrofolate cyclo-ligase
MKNQSRQKLRQLRLELAEDFRKQAALKVTQQVCELAIFQNSQHIAAYMPMNGELDPGHILTNAWKAGKSCYLPVVLNNKNLAFVKYAANGELIASSFGILEPKAGNNCTIIKPQELDLVIVPLVGFDQNCYRLGAGGGCYDRTFAAKKPRPFLLGIGYEMQKVAKLPREPWDVQLAMVITETNSYGTI